MSLDSDQTTLHLRCGTDIGSRLEAANLSGDFLEYSDPVCQGPVPEGPDLLSARTNFLATAYGDGSATEKAETLSWLEDKEQRLTESSERYQRVVLWFEHDSYDQLILCRVLAHFAMCGSPTVLEMVTTDHYPGISRFIGIGQLDGDALQALWKTKRTAISQEQLQLGLRAWQALRQPTPEALAALATTPEPLALPYLAQALKRHLQELPSMNHGLGLTEALTLEQLRDGAKTAGQLFRNLMKEAEPLPWLGDLMYWHIIQSMMAAGRPPIAVSPDSLAAEWPHRELSLTETGLALLNGDIDWRQCQPPERWLGGVPLGADHADWRWNPATQTVCLRPQSG